MITPRRDIVLDLASIPRRIGSSGFRAGAMWIRVRGEVAETQDGRRGYRIRNWPESIAIDGEWPSDAAEPVEFEVIVGDHGLRLRRN